MSRVAVILALLLAGCVVVRPAVQPGVWSHPDRSAEQTAIDAEECHRAGERYANEVGNPYAIVDKQRQCMELLGYTWTPAPR